MKQIFTLIAAIVICAVAQAQIINTIAGTGFSGFSGDGGPATSAQIGPVGIWADAAGNIYFADQGSNRIRKVSASGTITTIAGNGNYASSGDGGAALSAGVGTPSDVAVDVDGNIYIAEGGNRIRKVNTSGVISLFAGAGNGGYSGDGGPATSAQLYAPTGIAVDGAGNVYIADQENNRIRMINTSGIISTVAGNGTLGSSGDGGPATSAELYNPVNVAVDNAGNIYISDYNRIRKVDAAGTITTIAGNGTGGFSGDGGPATAAQINNYSGGVAVDLYGNVYFCDALNFRIRKINTSGIISTFAGTGTPGYTGNGGPADSAKIGGSDIATDGLGNVYLSSSGAIRQINDTSNAGLLPPSGLSVVAVRSVSHENTLTWHDNSNNETGFKIERSLNNSSGWNLIDSVMANTTSYADSLGLSNATTYFYRVNAYNTHAISAYSNVTGVTTLGIYDFNETNFSVSVYPNPFNNTAVLKINAGQVPGNSGLIVYDAIGQVVKTIAVNSNAINFSRDGLENGIYFYKLVNMGSATSLHTGYFVVN